MGGLRWAWPRSSRHWRGIGMNKAEGQVAGPKERGLPRGYKQTEVGVIPEDWRTSTIGESMRLVNGMAFKPAEWSDRGLPIIRIQNLNDSRAPFNYFEGDVERRYIIEPGDLLFAWSGTTGTSFGARVWNGPIGVLNQHIFKVLPDQRKLVRDYAFLVLRKVQEGIEKQAHGFKASFVHVKRSDLVGVELPIPPTNQEQQAIAGALSDADALIESLAQLLAKKRDLKQGAMQELLSGRSRLTKFKPDQAQYRQTEVGLIPTNWDVVTLASVAKTPMQNGLFFNPSHKGFGVRLINVGDLFSNSPIDVNSLELFNATAKECERFKVEDGDLFFTRSSIVPSGIAHCNIYRSGNTDSVVFDSHVIRFRPNPSVVSPAYLFRACLASVARQYLVSHAKSGTMTTIDQGVLGGCPVLLPPRPEQEAIDEVLSDMDTEVTNLESKLTKARHLKQGMMQALLTGRIRLI